MAQQSYLQVISTRKSSTICCEAFCKILRKESEASFKIEEYQYYLSPASCYRAIAMKNAVVYTNEYHLTNIFYENDKIGYCLPIYILMMMNEEGGNNKELSLKQIQDNIVKVMKCSSDVEREKRTDRRNCTIFCG